MIFAYPMTVIVAVVLTACLITGLVIVCRSMAGRKSLRGNVCDTCRNINPGHAKFCAHCGQKLTSQRSALSSGKERDHG